ncbi:putative ABC transporter, AAA+ ATPase domain, ABC-2 type transporter, ABC-transporter [Dioscorea sansibarensis]
MSPWTSRDGAVFSRASTPARSTAKSPWAQSPYINEDEEELRWAALERLPLYAQMRTAILREVVEGQDGRKRYEHRQVDVMRLELSDRQEFIERLIRVAEEDNERFLKNVRARYDKVGIELPTVEVRFEHVRVEAECYIGNRATPTLLNKVRDVAETLVGLIGVKPTEMTNLTILSDVSGIIKPSRMTLLLGPPSSGKTTLLKALASKLESSLKMSGDVTYNGYSLDEFVPQKTAAYISQNDVHMGEMTVKEILDFSARCQGVGNRYELLWELARREREAGVYPDPEIDFFMKATAVEGGNNSLQTDYTLRILGLDICADTIVGNEMLRGVSGGQKKRVTTGEMIVGPTKTLFMDEISTGLDSSTTFQIVKCLQQIVHHGEATILMSLLQPAPETYELFDDVMLIAEGKIVYQGPREFVLDFFESCGFRCPARKGVADFLQEVTSWKDQEQYWADRMTPYRYISVSEFAERFKRFHVGRKLKNEFSVPFDKHQGHTSALVFSKYSVSFKELLNASFFKEWLLFKRNSLVYIFKTVQIVIVATIASTVFLRTRLHSDTEADGALYIGALIFGLVVNMFNGFTELALVIAKLPVFYKHRDLYFYPPWLFVLPNVLIGIPPSIIESIVWVSITYFTIGFAPEANRFFKQTLLTFLIQQTASSLFRLLAGVCRSTVISTTWGSLMCLVMFVLGGFILPREIIPKVWYWGYWVSPLTYAYNALAVNEMFGSRWMNKFVSFYL